MIAAESLLAVAYLDPVRQHARVHRLRLAAAPRAAVARGHLRLREPGRRGRARGASSCTSRSARGRSSPSAVILAAVAIIVTARGRLAGPAARRSGDARGDDARTSDRTRSGRPSWQRRVRRAEAGVSLRLALGEHRPADPPGHRHHRDHRVHADAGRERRAVGDVEAGDDRARGVAPDPAARIGRVFHGGRAHPQRAHLVGRATAPRLG